MAGAMRQMTPLTTGPSNCPVAGKGSAIFFHVARAEDGKGTPAFKPTEGCVAVEQEDLLAIAAQLTRDMVMRIERMVP